MNYRFHRQLTTWYKENSRDLPWRETSDPYLIWLSEIILQQTRVDQGLPYFQKFAKQFPRINDLAAAEEQEVLKLWQGLGYYSRARNLLKGARYIVKECNAVFPHTYTELLKIPGVGPYTAAAIASFAFSEPKAVVDGNVLRVLSRYFAIDQAVDKSEGKKVIQEAADELMDPSQPALFNQAIMELGSQICLPTNPQCSACPVGEQCIAASHGNQKKYPVKAGRVKVKTLHLNYFFIRYKQRCYIEQRQEGFWKNLYQFPLVEGPGSLSKLLDQLQKVIHYQPNASIHKSHTTRHILSHRTLLVDFYTIDLQRPAKPLNSHIFEIELRDLQDKYPVPVLIDQFLKIQEHGKQSNISRTSG